MGRRLGRKGFFGGVYDEDMLHGGAFGGGYGLLIEGGDFTSSGTLLGRNKELSLRIYEPRSQSLR
jgi:hypothetical protein